MLALGRKEGQSFRIFHKGIEVATVEVARVSANRVTVGIEAPDDVRIVRTELLEQPHDVGSPVA